MSKEISLKSWQESLGKSRCN